MYQEFHREIISSSSLACSYGDSRRSFTRGFSDVADTDLEGLAASLREQPRLTPHRGTDGRQLDRAYGGAMPLIAALLWRLVWPNS